MTPFLRFHLHPGYKTDRISRFGCNTELRSSRLSITCSSNFSNGLESDGLISSLFCPVVRVCRLIMHGIKALIPGCHSFDKALRPKRIPRRREAQ